VGANGEGAAAGGVAGCAVVDAGAPAVNGLKVVGAAGAVDGVSPALAAANGSNASDFGGLAKLTPTASRGLVMVSFT
jgi:hypothetical protein